MNSGNLQILGKGSAKIQIFTFWPDWTPESLAGTVTTNIGLDDFDKLEMKREKLELELGIE